MNETPHELMDPDTFEARMQHRRDMRQCKRDLAYLLNVAVTIVGAALFALVVIAVVWGLA